MLTNVVHPLHVPELRSLVHDIVHEGFEHSVDLFHFVDGDVAEVDGDGRLRVEEDVGVDVGGQRLRQLNEALLKWTDR